MSDHYPKATSDPPAPLPSPSARKELSATGNDIFVSYARADEARVQPLVRALEAAEWSVWWDRTLVAGATWDSVIEEQIARAKCVVVVWSETSISSAWVRAEAEEGRKRNVLVPVLLDPVAIPLAFRRLQAASLEDWSGDSSSQSFQAVRRAVSDAIAGIPPSRGFARLGVLGKFFRLRRRLFKRAVHLIRRSAVRVATLLLTLLFVWWAVSSRLEWKRWEGYVARLQSEPGLLVIYENAGWWTHTVAGLRDPLARDPNSLMAEAGVSPSRVSSRWETFQVANPAFVLHRARRILQPPSGVDLTFERGVLRAHGPVDAAWIIPARMVAMLIPGVSEFEHELPSGAPGATEGR